ncbi:GNAT family N-acetyltransferase, partial [Vibrio vulnificus]|nr:GNAT family N-acetyltransferase [Vibrio vulnificus]
ALCFYREMMSLRDVIDSDWNQIYKLIEDNMLNMQIELGLKWDRESIIRHYKSKSVIVEVKRDHISGFIAYHQNEDVHFIDSLQVAQGYQNRLAGYRLLKSSLLKTSALPMVQKVRCCVFENNAAKEQYFSVGFRELSRSKGVLTLEMPMKQLIKRLRLAKT